MNTISSIFDWNSVKERLPEAIALEVRQRLEPLWRRDDPWWYADLDTQTITRYRGLGAPLFRFEISSAINGIGNLMDSERTPLGLHVVVEKIGAGCAKGTIFRHRVATESIATPVSGKSGSENLITTRILRLRGLQAGYNLGLNERGQSVDSYDRFIYIHGANRRFLPGERTSKGCLTLRDDDMVDLFDRVSEGEPILITGTDWRA